MCEEAQWKSQGVCPAKPPSMQAGKLRSRQVLCFLFPPSLILVQMHSLLLLAKVTVHPMQCMSNGWL